MKCAVFELKGETAYGFIQPQGINMRRGERLLVPESEGRRYLMLNSQVLREAGFIEKDKLRHSKWEIVKVAEEAKPDIESQVEMPKADKSMTGKKKARKKKV